jgi:hypothetical protein
MALTDAQKAQVRLYLGFSDMSRHTPTHWRLESMLSGALSTEGEAVVVAILTSLAAVDAAYMTGSSSALAVAGLKSVDNNAVVWQDGSMGVQASLAAQGRRFVSRLALTLGVEPFADVFGGGSGVTFGTVGRA